MTTIAEKRKHRAELAAEVARLHEAGQTYPQIAERLGIARSYAQDLGNDPDQSKRRERLRRYEGVCVECGGPTSGNGGHGTAPTRCRNCTTMMGMGGERPSEPSIRRTLPVRLCDLPESVLIAGANEACRREHGDLERQELLVAALLPSDTVYWLAESAGPLLEQLMQEPPGG